MSLKSNSDSILITSLYVGCALLVLAYVNMYALFTYLNEAFGSSFIASAPFLAPLLIALLFIFYFLVLKNRTDQTKWRFVLPGIIILLCALAIPNPDFPVKRIHVTQYAILSVLVRYTMSYRIRGTELLVYSIIFTTILGIHDEFLQGIHERRTYGLRDMAVNGLSAAGSGLVLHGLGIFSGEEDREQRKRTYTADALYLSMLGFSLAALAFPLTTFRGQAMPLWPFLPLSAVLVYWSCLAFARETDNLGSNCHGLAAVSLAAFLFLLYPIIVHGLQVTFR